MRLAAPLAVACLSLAGAGCGTAPANPVRAKVEQFAAEARRHDYAAICDDVLATALLERLAAAGISCPGALAQALNGVRQPVLSIGRVRVQGAHAAVLALTAAAGQPASVADLELIHESGGWRITSLGAADPALR